MTQRIAIVDYGAGNIGSIRHALARLGYEAITAHAPEEVLTADRLILPGVGSAKRALGGLRERWLDQALDEAVRRRGRPMLGICVGMQVLAETLYEFGEHRGLGWIAGSVVDIHSLSTARRVPHMGWSAVSVGEGGRELFEDVRGDRQFYFCHSFAFAPTEPASVVATVDYGGPLTAAVRTGTAWAVQFHPEKSQLAGEALLNSFLEWTP